MGAIDQTLVQEQTDDLVSDSLSPRGVPERVNYATGVLLDAADFADEQRYVRGRQARAFAALYGTGTMAGMRVSCPVKDNPLLEVTVAPGLALDRLGRVIEVRREQCLKIKLWLDERNARVATDAGRIAVITSVRAAPKVLAFDVFARFVICPHGKTPAFAAGPFNATDYVVPSRLADAFEITLDLAHAVRVHPLDPEDLSTELAVPAPRSAKLEEMLAALNNITDPKQLEAGRRAWSVESVLDAWPTPAPEDPTRLPKLREHARGGDWDKVLLARVTLPVLQDSPSAFPAPDPARLQDPDGKLNLADNSLRPVVFTPYSWRGAQ